MNTTLLKPSEISQIVEERVNKAMKAASRFKLISKLGRKHKRRIELMVLVLNGATFREAGAMFGVSTQRARQLVHEVTNYIWYLQRQGRIAPNTVEIGNTSIKLIRQNAPSWLKAVDELIKIVSYSPT